MQVSLASAAEEDMEMPADMYVSRTISLNGDLAASAAPQQGMAAPNLHSLMAIIRADLPCKHACGPIAASHGPDNNIAVNAGVLLGSQLHVPLLQVNPDLVPAFGAWAVAIWWHAIIAHDASATTATSSATAMASSIGQRS